MKKVLIIITKAPYGTSAAAEGFRAAIGIAGMDVDTTIVDGRILMRGRRLVHHDEEAILDRAERAFRLMIERAGLA